MSTHGLKQDADRMERDAWRLFKAVVLILVGFALGVYVADRQEENLREIAPELVEANPVAQASTERDLELRQGLRGRLDRANRTLAACRVDRAILEATQGVRFPRIVVGR